MNQYWYPNMGNADIIDSLDQLGLTVSHQQLLRPTPEIVMSICCTCLQQVFGLNGDSFQEPVNSFLSTLDEFNTVSFVHKSL